jgi:hypothetical protein
MRAGREILVSNTHTNVLAILNTTQNHSNVCLNLEKYLAPKPKIKQPRFNPELVRWNAKRNKDIKARLDRDSLPGDPCRDRRRASRRPPGNSPILAFSPLTDNNGDFGAILGKPNRYFDEKNTRISFYHVFTRKRPESTLLFITPSLAT